MNVATRYIPSRLIGHGSFSEVYEGTDTQTGELVAIKTELCSTPNPQLFNESQILSQVNSFIGFPTFIDYGEAMGRRLLIMQLLGPTLEELKQIHKKFSLKSTIRIGIQLLQRFRNLHSKGFIYRDVKPENFVITRNGPQNIIYMIDFGLCCSYLTPEGQHVPFHDHCPLTGNVKYASISKHHGLTQGRKDDIESLIYMLIYFANGSLPWGSIEGNSDRETIELIRKEKERLSPEDICLGLPYEFTTLLADVRKLDFDEEPHYDAYIMELRTILQKCGFIEDGFFEWHHDDTPLSMSYTWKTSHQRKGIRNACSNKKLSILAKAVASGIGRSTNLPTSIQPFKM